MAARVEWTLTDRYDTVLGGAGDGFVSATESVLTRWSTTTGAPEAIGTVRGADPSPGPVRLLATPGAIGWGPTLVRDDEPVWSVQPLVAAALADLGEGARRVFRLVAGAVSDDGGRVGLVLERIRSRTTADRAPAPAGPSVRVAVVDAADRRRTAVLDDETVRPTCVAWAGAGLVFGSVGRLRSLGTPGAGELDLMDRTAARSVAIAPDGRVAVGTASGRIVDFAGMEGPSEDGWPAHDAPVTALAWSPDGTRLASGGGGSMVRIWRGGSRDVEVDVEARVESLAWLDADRLIVKVGGPGGRILGLGAEAG